MADDSIDASDIVFADPLVRPGIGLSFTAASRRKTVWFLVGEQALDDLEQVRAAGTQEQRSHEQRSDNRLAIFARHRDRIHAAATQMFGDAVEGEELRISGPHLQA